MLRQPRALVPFVAERRSFQVIEMLLRDSFSSGTLANANSQNRSADIGFIRYNNNGGTMSIASGKLVINGTPGGADRYVSGTGSDNLAFARAAGRAFRVQTSDRVATSGFALLRFTTDVIGGISAGQTGIIANYSAVDTLSVYPHVGSSSGSNAVSLSSGEHTIALVMRSTGALAVVRDGSGTPQLAWVMQAASDDWFAAIVPGATAMELKFDDFEVFDHASFADDWATASVHTTPSTSGTTYSAQADGLHHLAFTLPGSPSADQVAVELRYRVQDTDNYWTCLLRRNSGNTNWDLRVDSVSGGVATNRKSVTNVGTCDRLIVYAQGDTHKHWTEDSGVPANRGSDLSNSVFSGEAVIAVVWDAATSIGSLDSWALTHALYDGLFA